MGCVQMAICTRKMHANLFQQIKAWFYNKTSKRSGGVKLVFNMGLAVGTKGLSEEQMYSKMYYESRLKAVIDEEVAEQGIPRDERLAFVNGRVAEMYEDEDEATKKEVRDAIQEESANKKEMTRLLKAIFEDESTEEFTPHDYAM